MATTNALALCPKCNRELKSAKSLECDQCGHKLKAPENPYFATPDYLYYQQKDTVGNLKEKTSESKAREKTLKEVIDYHSLYFRKCPDEDRVASLSDSLNSLQSLVISDCRDIALLRQITSMGKKIGKISEAIENYAESGGMFYGEELFKPAKPTGSDEDTEQTPRTGAMAE